MTLNNDLITYTTHYRNNILSNKKLKRLYNNYNIKHLTFSEIVEHFIKHLF